MLVLKEGHAAWKRWKERQGHLLKDHFIAQLIGAKLQGVDLKYYDLSYADLNGADLSMAILRSSYLDRTVFRNSNLSGADLGFTSLKYADLTNANLSEANLRFADLSYANLRNTDLSRADLRDSNLKGVTFRETCFCGAFLSGQNLHSCDLRYLDFKNADLTECNLIDANLNGSNLTGAKLWESKLSGWSIKGVACEYAYFDRECQKKEVYTPGEFERLYSEKTKIVLHYENGMSPFEVNTLPALIKLIEKKHLGCQLHLKSIQEDAGGVSVSIVVDELGEGSVVEMQHDGKAFQQVIAELKDEQRLRSHFQSQVQILTEIITDKMGGTYHIGKVIGAVGDGASIGCQTIHANDLDTISKMISEILAAWPEIARVLPTDKGTELDVAVREIQKQASANQKDPSKLKKALGKAKNILATTGDLAGKWMPIFEKLHEGGLI